MRVWSLLYALSSLVSSVACGTIAFGLFRRAGHLRESAVRFIFFFFFLYAWLWSLFHAAFYCDAWLENLYDGANDSALDDTEYVDALGLRGVALSSVRTSFWLSLVIVLGDTALMGCSLWMLPMAWELTKLARKAMDRGAEREAVVATKYCKWVHVLIALFFLAESVFTIYNQGFNSQSYRVFISGGMIQLVTLGYVTYALVTLKCSGRKYETVNGAMVMSPLYKRIRSIMVVYGVFSFQYEVLSLVVLFSRFDVELPTAVLGASSLLFINSGTALSIVMGCSQECVVRSFGRFIPDEYVQEFYVSDPTLAMANAAIGYSPPRVNPVFVFTDIESSTLLWSFEDGAIMRRANEIHDDIIRSSLAQYRGYEITTAGDAFQLAFHSIKDAIEYCIQVQIKLLAANWPKKLHDLAPATKCKRSKTKKLVFRGLRVRMGVHDAQQVDGVLVKSNHPVTGKLTYTGLSEVIANEIADVGAGGQICVTRRVAHWLANNSAAVKPSFEVDFLGQHTISQLNTVLDVFQVTPTALAGRKKVFDKAWAARLASIEVVDDTEDEPGTPTDVLEVTVV